MSRRRRAYATRPRRPGRRPPQVDPETVERVANSIRVDALRHGRKLTYRQVMRRVEAFLKSRYWTERKGLPKSPGS